MVEDTGTPVPLQNSLQGWPLTKTDECKEGDSYHEAVVCFEWTAMYSQFI